MVRRNKVVEYTLEGHPVQAIADALQVSPSVVTSDRTVMKHKLEGVKKRTWKTPRPIHSPQPFDWRNDTPADVPAYVRTTPVRGVESLYRQLTGSNAMNRLAHNIEAARARGDKRWLAKSERQIELTLDYLAGMLEMFEDDDALQQATSFTARDDLSTRSLDLSNTSQPLPVKGTGVLPSVTFAWIWRYWMAGIPLEGDTIRAIASKMNVTPGRVERAIKEFLARYTD